MMDDTTLCEEVAEKMLRWKPNPRFPGTDNFLTEDGGWTVFGLTWDDSGRVVEKMRELGWKFSLACESKGRWTAIFWPSGEVFMSLEDTTQAETMPRAVFLAALAAVGGQRAIVVDTPRRVGKARALKEAGLQGNS